MTRTMGLFLITFFFTGSLVFSQGQSYTIKKISSSLLAPTSDSHGSSNISFWWVASNNTSVGGNFFIYDNLPAGSSLLSAQREGSSFGFLGMNRDLPLVGPAGFLLGPFNIAAGSSVTFAVQESQSSPEGSSGSAQPAENFALFSQTQLAGKANKISSDAESLLAKAGTPTSSQSNGHGLLRSAFAEPNISRDGQPINFLVSLDSPALIGLSLYSLSGEKISTSTVQGNSGSNSIVWGLQNLLGQKVASGLYLYYLRISSDGTVEIKMGKILVIR